MNERDSDDCRCADGSDFVYFSRVDDHQRVALYFQGGGACFSEESCRFDSGTYKVTTGPQDDPTDAAEVFVTGSSAGGVPAPIYGGFVSDALPDARVTVLADASGGYPSTPAVNAAIGGLWGAHANAPDWPEAEGVIPEAFGIPDLFVLAGLHDPDIVMARYDNAHDAVQQSFSDLAGLSAGGLPAVLDLNEENIEAVGVDLSVYVAPGEDHTILGSDQLYDLVVEGAPFVEWLTSLLAGEPPGDVRCVDCGKPTTDG